MGQRWQGMWHLLPSYYVIYNNPHDVSSGLTCPIQVLLLYLHDVTPVRLTVVVLHLRSGTLLSDLSPHRWVNNHINQHTLNRYLIITVALVTKSHKLYRLGPGRLSTEIGWQCFHLSFHINRPESKHSLTWNAFLLPVLSPKYPPHMPQI